VKRILWIFPRPKGAAEPKPDSREDDREPEEEVVLVPSITEVRLLRAFLTAYSSYMGLKNPDPLHVLLEYIANVSSAWLYQLSTADYLTRTVQQAKDCHLALVHDSDLEQILGEGDVSVSAMYSQRIIINRFPSIIVPGNPPTRYGDGLPSHIEA
jgi:hypothetical protein